MATYIDKLAVVKEGASIGEDCYIGPFCTISETAVIGDRTTLQSHVVVDGNTTIGSDCKVFPFASIGTQSQDLKWVEGNQCFTTVGNNTIIREYVTIHAGTDDGTYTKVGNNCALLALSHVGHNCEVGNDVVLSHNATLGGHVLVGDHANIGGLSAVHQFVHIGRNAMVAGMARVIQDILPFTIAEGAPASMRIVNKVGMERCSYSKEETSVASSCYKILFMRNLKLEEALEEINNKYPDSGVAKEVVTFATEATRGLARK
ncbi:MAG: acyl-ACP--UDP-N-acetylglucosamine O-acyltransferase [Lentisphaeraceae bacterium]|nr:acyl-ACP--UDP-N-acetylglucosamine O-acyltransferase [Lentisphaeraceae bacterium]